MQFSMPRRAMSVIWQLAAQPQACAGGCVQHAFTEQVSTGPSPTAYTFTSYNMPAPCGRLKVHTQAQGVPRPEAGHASCEPSRFMAPGRSTSSQRPLLREADPSHTS